MDIIKDAMKGAVRGLLQRLWKESKPGIDRSQMNRFKYNAENVRLFGRDAELEFLWQFCHADSHFSWFAISGEGGSGKTRLAHEFGKKMKQIGWTYKKVDNALERELEDVRQALDKNPRDTLLVLDYVKWHTDTIGKWLYDLWSKWHERNLKIRVLLVERDSIIPHELRWKDKVITAQYHSMGCSTKFLDKYGFMRLLTLKDEDLLHIVEDFAASTEQKDLVNANSVIMTLHDVDPQFRRPLYALFLADAQITGEDLLDWDRREALEYIYQKEVNRIQNNVNEFASSKQDAKDMDSVAFHALLLATLLGGIAWDSFLTFIPLDAEILRNLSTKAEPTGQPLLAMILGIPYSKHKSLFIPPLKPDIMGGFFATQQLYLMDEEERRLFASFAWRFPKNMSAFIDRTLQDHSELFVESDLYKDICKDYPFSFLFTLAKNGEWAKFVSLLTNFKYIEENYSAFLNAGLHRGPKFFADLLNKLCSFPPPSYVTEKLLELKKDSFKTALEYKFFDHIGCSIDRKARCAKCGKKGVYQGWRDVHSVEVLDRYVIICPNCFYHYTHQEFQQSGYEDMPMVYDYSKQGFS